MSTKNKIGWASALFGVIIVLLIQIGITGLNEVLITVIGGLLILGWIGVCVYLIDTK